MILELDMGNSRCKWRLVEALALDVRARGVVPASAAAVRGLIRELPWAPSRLRVASVCSEAVEAALLDEVAGRWSAGVEFACSEAVCQGVHNGYRNPERLGVDRWLAMVSAWQRLRRPVLVVDAGSALTLDLVDGEGRHRGGHILAGRAAMIRALNLSTAGVQVPELAEQVVDWGRDTVEAVTAGAALALPAAVLDALVMAECELGQRVELVLSGGDGEWLERQLQRRDALELFRIDDLVLDGLQWALP